MDIGAFILAISFVVIVSVEIISYLINSEITKTKTEKKLFFFQTVSKVLFIVVIITMFQLIVKILEIVKNNISDKSGFNRTKINNVI